jgi:hypothetical protein
MKAHQTYVFQTTAHHEGIFHSLERLGIGSLANGVHHGDIIQHL